ncbi:MAG: hypothetical protein LUC34_01425, partial [Campylobacter sp.]|nr:hypothetical protein [Campylobacter sp.]
YWGEIESSVENIIIRNMFEKPDFLDFEALSNGLWLIENLISQPNLSWFYEHISNTLSVTKNKEEFRIYAKMLAALQEKIIHIPFIYNEISGLFQLKIEQNISGVYLVFSNFAPIIFNFNDEFINVTTPFRNVANLLKNEFECEISVRNVLPFWNKNDKIVDFKG